MPEYRVTWIIELDAESHEKAAKEALEIQRDPGSTATVFVVKNLNTKEILTIDLEDLEEGKD
mgnify:CR=1 FL=1